MKRTIATLMFAAAACTSATAWGQANLYLVRVGGLDSLSTSQVRSNPNDPLSPLVTNPDNAFWVGHNPTAVAYGKGNLFVGGILNGSVIPLDGDDANGNLNTAESSPFNVSVVRVGSILTTRTFTKMPASRASVPNSRGYTAGDYRGDVAGGQVVFAFDNGGNGAANAISVYGNVDGAGTPTVVNQISAGTGYRGACGPAFDFGPAGTGFPAIGGGPAICYMLFNDGGYFGMNPNALTTSFVNSVYGPLSLFNPSNGDAAGNTLHRDVDVNPTNGNIVSISSAAVRVMTRNPDGTVTPKSFSPIGPFNASADFVSWQHVNILNGFPGGDRIIWNQRLTNATGQPLTSVLKMNRFDTGAADTINLLAADGTTLVLGTAGTDVNPDGAGWYDFAWEQSTQTLVILDSSARKYYVFSTEQPAPCCVGTACFVMNPSNCTAAHVGGTVAGPAGSTCGPSSCTPQTACCFPNGTCQVLDAAGCVSAGGTSNAATACTPNPCPQPSTGRCCVGARCVITADANACTALVGGSAGSNFTANATTCNAAGVFNTPCCFADYNKVGGVTVQDIFDFLSGWFSNNPNANVAGDGTAPTVQDIFDFLAAWFSGGCV